MYGGVVLAGNVTVAKPNAVDTLPGDSVSSSTDTIVAPPSSPSPSPSPSPPTLSATDVDSLVPSLSDDDAMEVDDDVGLAVPKEVYNHASLDDSPPGPILAASPRKSTPSVNLDTLDFSKVPAWLQEPLKYLRKKFRGELEDEVLGAFVALEMAWQPVRAQLFFHRSNLLMIKR